MFVDLKIKNIFLLPDYLISLVVGVSQQTSLFRTDEAGQMFKNIKVKSSENEKSQGFFNEL